MYKLSKDLLGRGMLRSKTVNKGDGHRQKPHAATNRERNPKIKMKSNGFK